MTRLSLVALFLATFLCIVAAKPLTEQVPMQSDGPVKTMDSWEWENCGSEEDGIQIESIDVSPDPPKPGKDLTVKVKAVALERVVEGAYADVTVKLGLIKLLQKQFDLCEEAEKANATVQCPVEKGSYDVTQTVALPKEIPQGPALFFMPHSMLFTLFLAKFVVLANGYSADDEDLFCVRIKISFLKRPFFGLM
ncbi:hypothetical protein HGRIS_007821 [Hohenbuehelia grisea]|uniref:Phosphatidylglycerol/phosphatidylinositol transfer protein n=1 Tax=Hohenbuehelia grisea TaxID=104357 RepID=A0ABR3J6E3_9AGAR